MPRFFQTIFPPTSYDISTLLISDFGINTIISGSLWHGPPAQLISAALGGQAQLFLSLPMLLELQETLPWRQVAEKR